jgi:hypothetical protein
MKPLLVLLFCLAVLCPVPAQAHVGSPDVFYDGMVGPWPARITIRMPGVVPGQAEILVQVQGTEPVAVSFVPLFSRIAISNAPPGEIARPVHGETNLYSGTMWLMTMGAYSIEVQIRGQSGAGIVQIPVNSVATTQLPLPPLLGDILLALGLLLFCGAMAIVAASAGESVLPPWVLPGKIERRKYWIAATVTGVVLALALFGGKKWWDVEEKNFRSRLHSGGWPDLAAEVRVEGGQRILRLTLGKNDFGPKGRIALARDHGKLLHLFLVGQPDHQAFGHIHPVRQGNTTFEVALPPLPAGDYEMFCDLTLESGLSSTATNSVQLPPVPASPAVPASLYLEPDPDDSWATNATVAVRENSGGATLCRLADGTQVIWKAHPPLRTRQDAGLQFEVLDQAGQPAELQPYMGMMSHAAVMRSDGRVFAHLHPSGNFSMAAQMFFDAKMAKENGGAGGMDPSMMMDHATMSHTTDLSPTNGGAALISLPYEFPTPGDYRVWVQIKTDGQVKTAIFDTTVK